MRISVLFAVLLATAGCYQLPGKPDSLAGSQPHVIYIVPADDELLPAEREFQIVVSEPLDTSTISPESIWLLEGNVSSSLRKDPSPLRKDLEKGRITSLPIRVEPGESEQIILIRLEGEFPSETAYTLVVTPAVLSTQRLPIGYFFKEYQVGSREAKESAVVENETPTPDATATENPESTPEEEIDENPGNQQEEQVPDGNQRGAMVINEIFYDAVGSDTDGVVFVELFGRAGLSLERYRLLFVNGDDGLIKDSITLPEGAAIGPDGFYLIADARTGRSSVTQAGSADLIDEFDPQNGPDAVQLVSPDGVLFDAVGYGEGMVPVGENGLAMYESSPAVDVVSGHSLERVSPGQDTDNNAADFTEREVPTPRQ